MPRLKSRWKPYKSQLELLTAKKLEEEGFKVDYEPERLEFFVPETRRTYTPDFKIKKNRYIECKGRLLREDRKKLLLVKEQHPNVRIFLLFERPNMTLDKRSKTTYAEWAEKNGFDWSWLGKGLKKEWLK